MGKKKRGPVVKKGLDEWMATYSDCVTLLFCFFVLLYASSTQDETKFQYIFQAFSTGGEFINTVVGQKPENANSGEGNSDLPPINNGEGSGSVSQAGTGDQPNTFDDLFNWIQKAAESDENAESIEVQGGETQLRILFDNDIMFDPDRAELKDSGKKALDLLVAPLKWADYMIKVVQVQGHTAAGGLSAVNDWDLSSVRATSVIKYLDFKRVVESRKFAAEGYAQYKPVDPLVPEKNRRVEIIITRNAELPEDTATLLDILTYDYNTKLETVDADGKPIESPTPGADDKTNAYLTQLQQKYEELAAAEGYAGSGTQVGPSVVDDLTVIPDKDFYDNDAEGNPIIPEGASEAAPEPDESETDETE